MKGILRAVLAFMQCSLSCHAHPDDGNATAQACKPSLKLPVVVIRLCLVELCSQLDNVSSHYGLCRIVHDKCGRILGGFHTAYVAELIKRCTLQRNAGPR